MDKAALLISGYCDNDLSDEESQWLAAWLRADPAHVDRLARDFSLHSRIYDLLQEQELQSDAWSETLEGTGSALASEASAAPRRAAPSHRRSWAIVFAALAASLVVAAALFVYFQSATVVAQVSVSDGAARASDGTKLLAGALLSAGETLRADRGHLIVTFECGAQVRIDAPAVFVVDSRSAGTLSRGSASARVPPQAVGFAIHTPLADIIDLGTQFHVQIVDEDRFDLHVFDGMVEVRLGQRFDRAGGSPLQISEGRSTRFDAAADAIVTLEYDDSLKESL